MTRTLYVLTTDPNRTWLISTLTPQEIFVESLFPRDPLPFGLFAGLVIDLDYLLLDRIGRDIMVKQASFWADRFPVALLSFNLEDGDEFILRSNGVLVSQSIDATVLNALLGGPPPANPAAIVVAA